MSTNRDELLRAKAKLEKLAYKKEAEWRKVILRLDEVRKELGEPTRAEETYPFITFENDVDPKTGEARIVGKIEVTEFVPVSKR